MSDFAVQEAIYNTVSQHPSVIATGATVVDFGPSADDGSTIFPYIAIGSFVLNEMDTGDTNGFEAAIRIHSYSDSAGAKECREMQGAIYEALHKAGLWATGFDSLLTYREDSRIMRTSSGAFHGVCEYRALLDAN